MAKAAKKAIDARYKLLDYIYTALHYQTTTGAPMINPLFFLYPNDANTFGIQEQWFYGDALLISPVTAENSDTVTYYLPNDIFYNYWSYEKIEGKGANVTESGLSTSDIPVHIRGGSIIPMRSDSANTTKALRENDFVVLVAPDANGYAKGRLYLDEGERVEQPVVSEIEFEFKDGKLIASGSFGYTGNGDESVTIATVRIIGQPQGGAVGEFDAEKGSIGVEGPWKLDAGFEIQF